MAIEDAGKWDGAPCAGRMSMYATKNLPMDPVERDRVAKQLCRKCPVSILLKCAIAGYHEEWAGQVCAGVALPDYGKGTSGLTRSARMQLRRIIKNHGISACVPPRRPAARLPVPRGAKGRKCLRCKAAMRPRRVSLREMPATVAEQARGLCAVCYRNTVAEGRLGEFPTRRKIGSSC